MRHHLAYFFLALGLAFLACNKMRIGVNTYDIKYADSATFDKDKKITFIDLTSDSRCPVDVLCIVPGIAILQLQATCIPRDTVDFELSFSTGMQDRRDTMIYDIYRVEILEVLPLPMSGENPEKEDYSIRVLIEKN